MPYIRPIREEDEQQIQGAGGGVGSVTAPQPGVQAAPAAQPGGGGGGGRFVNLQDYVRANQGGAQKMASQVLGGIEKQGVGVGGPQAGRTGPGAQAVAGNPLASMAKHDEMGQAQAVESKAGLLGSFGGQQELLRQEYGKQGGYSEGENLLDAALMGQVAGGDIARVKNRFAGVSDYVRGRQARNDALAASLPPPINQYRTTQKGQIEATTDEGPRNKAIQDQEIPEDEYETYNDYRY